MSVARAQQEIDAPEFAEWLAYYSIEPFGEERGDLRAGIVAAQIANAFRGKNQRPFKAIEFMPLVNRQPKRQQSVKYMVAVLKSAVKAAAAYATQQCKKGKR